MRGARPSASPTATTSATSRWWCRPGRAITGFDKLAAGQRIGVVQGTVQEAYVVDTLHLEPVKFPDYNTVYASLKTRQIDAWVAPSQQAQGTVQPGDPARDHRKHLQPGQFRGLRGGQGEQAADRRAELRAGRGDRRRHLGEAVLRLGAARTAARLEARFEGRAAPQLPDFAAIAAEPAAPSRHRGGAPKSTLSQLKDSFLDWDLYKQAIPDLFKTGLPNTLILTVSASVIGLVLGMGLAVAGISRSRWLRWPARVYTDIFRGLPEVVIILLIGLGIGPVVGGLTGNNPYPLGIAALGLMAAAYIGEIFRSGIQSVEPGQMEASRALGFSYPPSMRLVVVPQGVRRVLPALVNQFISLLKASSLVYFLGLVANQRELFQVGRDLNAQTGNLSPLVAAGSVLSAADDSADPPGQLHRHPPAHAAANPASRRSARACSASPRRWS